MVGRTYFIYCKRKTIFTYIWQENGFPSCSNIHIGFKTAKIAHEIKYSGLSGDCVEPYNVAFRYLSIFGRLQSTVLLLSINQAMNLAVDSKEHNRSFFFFFNAVFLKIKLNSGRCTIIDFNSISFNKCIHTM